MTVALPRKVPRWLFGWADKFADTWGALPAEPILYFFMFTGMASIILTPGGSGTVTHTPIWVSDIWRISGVVAPALCLLAWWLVNYQTGRLRLAGLYTRLGGDIGQAVSLAVFLIIRLAYAPVNDDPHTYLMHVIFGVFTFVMMLVIRDFWIIGRVEEIAAHLQRLAEAGIDPQEVR